MSKLSTVHWSRWAAGIAGAFVAIKSVAFVAPKVVGFVNSEAQARGSDVNFVLGLAGRRKHGHG